MKLWATLMFAACACLASSSWAEKPIKVIYERKDGLSGHQTRLLPFTRSVDPDTKATLISSIRIDDVVVLAKGTENLAVDYLEVRGGDKWPYLKSPIGTTVTKGALRIRAAVRYGWFDGFESYDNTPLLELFVNVGYAVKLPRLQGRTAGYVDVFTVTNEKDVLARLFSAEELERVRAKEILFIEKDSDLVLEKIGFTEECGTRYWAHVKSAKPWKQATLMAKNDGWDGHC
jgi:hypothetical protein